MAGSSNFTSWVSTATASFGPRPISSATSSGQPTTSASTSGNRSGVANDARPSMTTVSKPSSRASRTSERATSTAPTTTSRGPDREDLDEQRARTELDGPRLAALERLAAAVDELRVQRRVAERAVQRAVVVDDQLGLGWRTLPRRVLAEAGRRRVGGSGVTTATRARRPRRATAASTATAGTAGSTKTSIVPPQASPTSQACSSLMP